MANPLQIIQGDALTHARIATRMKSSLILILSTAFSLGAMDRFEALSMLESGDNDFAVGKHGEVSRYQIMPSVWREHTQAPISRATNGLDAGWIAMQIMDGRVEVFEVSHHKQPSDFQFALLWHCPARVDKPTPSDVEYAKRFENLVSRKRL